MALHILNGDALREALEQAGLDGELLVMREAMVCGPCAVPGSGERDSFLDARARHLAEAYGANPLLARRDLGRREARLDALRPGEEVWLWFDDDLFCQVHLWYLLDRVADRCPVLLVGGGEHGAAVTAADVPRLLSEARPADEAAALGRRAYRAFAGPDPAALQRLAEEDDGPLPALGLAARLHLERLPAVGDGLGRIERALLRYAAAGIDRFGDLFRQFLGDEGGYGLGDAQLFYTATTLCAGPRPLLRLYGAADAARAVAAGELRRTSFSITDEGRAALSGELDGTACIAVERWLGGLRLPPGQAPYRWDEARRQVVAR